MKDGVDLTGDPEMVNGMAGWGQREGQVWNAESEMPRRHPGGDEKGTIGHAGPGIRGDGWAGD